MTVQEQNVILAKEYSEAIRYMDNAKETLKKARRDGSHYVDRKYVRTACGTAYNGILIALDAWLAVKGIQKPTRQQLRDTGKKRKLRQKPHISIDYYKPHVAQLDGKLSKCLLSAYDILHLYGYYDGETNVKAIESGFDDAYEIINKIKPYA
jgi:hypothetical protein